ESQNPADLPINSIPLAPDLGIHVDPSTGEPFDPLGFLGGTSVGESLASLRGWDWFSLIGLAGIFIAFGHTILAMSGEETLAQVYREVEAPKLVNFKKAAIIVFLYSLVLTAGISFLAVLLIPNDVRLRDYGENMISGLAMYMVGPAEARF